MADDETAKDGAVDKQRPQVGGFRSFDAQGFLQAQQRQKEEQGIFMHATRFFTLQLYILYHTAPP